ncbi:GT2 family glycosyltransferase/ubiquinone/menaquinone biosynthesis C-methylase UbiE/predicted nuclease with TOPRIM domain [Lysinibacillus composti]|uniref:Glycosyltransferase n=1 Tax=Lysinibacillus composti TaxID=720633 RepID=A0A3N9UHE7_9BACI|nr:glycosyltransferase [Lysinibacillus composti]MBM7609065.1 GT2 family glycosyltransferase/ubiquinone/menaquinone biosynthesis C-methylase UbiE/predicted nuclease with TOPRIM domain [Lysinibacillus composti]RQW75514.1 glycosyltransferase [Lysinibacillus composti]
MEFTGERFIPNVIEDNEIKIEHLQRYQSIQELVSGKIVLDAACGEGYGSNYLATNAEKVVGIDIDEESIVHAQNKYLKRNLEFMAASIEKLPFEDHSFDVVVSFETIEHVNENLQQQFLTEIKRVLKEDGILIMSTPNKKIYTDFRNYHNPFHVKEFYKDEFYCFLSSAFNFVDFSYQTRENVYLLGKENGKTFANLNHDSNLDVNSKYIVAICSDVSNNEFQLNSVVVESGDYNLKISRILQLQDEVEERNKHIHYLDSEIEEKNNYIVTLQDENTKLKNQLNQVEIIKQQVELFKAKLNEINDQLAGSQQEKQDLIEKVQKLETKENQLHHENEQLKEKERTLNNIYDSDGWKLLLKYYGVRDKIVPSDGKVRLLAKLFKKIVIDGNFRLLNKENVKKFIYYAKNQNLSMLENRVDNYIERNTSDTSEFKLSLIDIEQSYEKITFEKFATPDVSIIIPVYNQWHYTYSCLKSILANTQNVSYEIIIADDMSSDETVNISEYVENIKVVRDGENRGFLLNCNNAAQYADGQYVLFLNNDTQVQEGWLDSLVQLIESDHQIGMVGSKLVYPDGRMQEAGGIIWNDASGWNFGRLDDPNKPEYNYVKEVDYISGAAIMIKKDLWETIGGFDERYVPAYFEDSDLAFEVRKHGFKVMLQPKSVVVHFEGISHGTNVSEGVKRFQELNKSKFIEKWSNELKTNHYRNGEHVFKARDRSKFKKTILVIDHYVPHFDKDAGSRTTYQYLKLFVQMGLNVKFIGDNYYKHEPYTTELEKLGIEVFYQPYNNKNIEQWFKQNGKYIDYVYMNRPHISIKYVDIVKKYTKAKVVYYGHDLHFLREYREYELTGNEALKKSSEDWRKTEFSLYEKSDVVYYPSDVEVTEIKKYYPTINAIAIPAYIFEEKEFIESNQADKEGLLFVGGFGHKPNIDAVLWFVSSVFPKIVEEKPDMKFYIVGSNPPNEISSLASKNIIVTGFVTDEELDLLYKKSKLVVVPLRYGAGVKGKVIEAMYNQVPIVTTSVGAEGIIDSENILMIADTESEFANQVINLYDNDEKLNELSQASLDYVNNHFTAKAVKEIISTDISN